MSTSPSAGAPPERERPPRVAIVLPALAAWTGWLLQVPAGDRRGLSGAAALPVGVGVLRFLTRGGSRRLGWLTATGKEAGPDA